MPSEEEKEAAKDVIRTYVLAIEPGTVIEPNQIRIECNIDEDIFKEVVVALITEHIITPVYRIDGQGWTHDLLRYIGVEPDKIFVAFKRMAEGEDHYRSKRNREHKFMCECDECMNGGNV